MQAVSVPSAGIQQLIDKGLFDRLPPSFTSFFFQRIQEWSVLFPAEQDYFERLFSLLDRAPEPEVARLFEPLREIERKMKINPKTWNPKEFTLENVDFLNRSPHYAEWRAEIARIFSLIDPMLDAEVSRTGKRRLVIVVSPAELPIGPDRMWTRLAGHGKRVEIQPEEPGDYLSLLLTGRPRQQQAASLPEQFLDRPNPLPYDAWVIEAGGRLAPYTGPGVVRLSYQDLEPYRERLMAEVKSMLTAEAIRGPRELGARLKSIRVPSGESVIDDSPVLAEFLRSVMLAGNGTLLINNTFVEWAAVQAARRARPRLTVVLFGIRNKVKPFSSLLIYADQEKANIIPSQMDVLGSYIDLEVFYQYVWQGFEKYAEYRGKTAYLFLGDQLEQMFVIAPTEFPALAARAPITLSQLHADCKTWLTS